MSIQLVITGSSSQEKTVLRTNLEAVREIAVQIRIRNLGGMIIIDLIDMELESSKEKVIQLFEKELKKDSVYTEIVSVSPLNLIQMTRKRTQKSLQGLMCDSCPVCEGDGYLRSSETIAEDIFRTALQQSFKIPTSPKKMEVVCHPLIGDWIQNQENEYLKFLAKKTPSSITVSNSRSFAPRRVPNSFLKVRTKPPNSKIRFEYTF